jgi:hypothetical protein
MHQKEKSVSTTHVPTPKEINARTALLFPDCSEGILRIVCLLVRWSTSIRTLCYAAAQLLTHSCLILLCFSLACLLDYLPAFL